MVPIERTRKIEVFIDMTWIPVQLTQVIEGDVIRQFDPDGTPYLVDGCHEVLVNERPSMSVTSIPSDPKNPALDEMTSDGKINGVYVDQPVPLGMVRRALNGDGSDLAAFVIKRNQWLKSQTQEQS